MRRVGVLILAMAVTAIAAWAVVLSGGAGRMDGEPAAGQVAGTFDPTMSGVCRFACAAPQPVDEASLVAQPGAAEGDFTRCPVSGVVFAVDGERPRVRVAAADYVVCCAECAGRLENHPERFLRL